MSDARSILKEVFGYDEFREPQGAIVDTLLDGEDALVVMPTGGGKSLCYQLPALLREGTGVVVSPLIALMQDQVAAMAELGIAACYLNSTLSPEAAADVTRRYLHGELDLLYIAPERLIQERSVQLFQQREPALFAIDEAHCVSQWGHDFRADYLQLSMLHELFPLVPRIALTATADERTRLEICRRLNLEDAAQFVCGFDRPNIQYRITQKDNEKRQLLQFLHNEHAEDSGIVYCLSRNKVDKTAHWLQQQGFQALPYHAGMSAEQRQHHQQRFLREDGIVMVATIAFGMGIDKPDVRFVAHLDLPKSVESYYQETGRAGRDGKPATAWMCYGLQDVIKLRQMLDDSSAEESFKRIEQHRLNAMLGLCEITSCRRQALLSYFGEQLLSQCGNCDTCLKPVDTWDGTEAVQKALSCVYRTGQRFGTNHIIDVLRGSDNEKIRQWHHQQLSTYGIGKDMDANQWRSVFRQLIARGYLKVDFDHYNALRLTEQCRALLRGDERIALRRDSREATLRPARANRDSTVSPEDKHLWDALKELRTALAEQHGVPPYVIFHDATLMEMVELRPQNPAALRRINGVGDAKLERYGEQFLALLGNFGTTGDGPAFNFPEYSGL